MIEVVLNDHDTVVSLGRIAARMKNPNGLLKVLGRRGSEELRHWFRARNSAPNKLGAPKSNFWNKVASATTSRPVEGNTRVRISISRPEFAQKVFGGPITPKRGSFLTIPVDPASRGRTVSVFEHETGIKLFRLRNKGGGFSKVLAGLVNGKQLKVFYILSKGVDQDPDPEALPPRERFNAVILDQAEVELRRAIRDGAAV